MLRLYDTATREVRELAMREPGTVSMYLCGPTVYGPPHLGHGRATLVYDVLRRYLEWTGIRVRLVSNITDIDDKIIERANREDRPWQDITHRCEDVWFDAMGRLGVGRPTADFRVQAALTTERFEECVAAGIAAGSSCERSMVRLSPAAAMAPSISRRRSMSSGWFGVRAS